ncbi:MAG: rubrerythrin family protein [Promethearchaeia archaeon]
MNILIQNLKDAIVGETKANLKYNLFAERARQENLPEVAELFKAVAFAETIHIKNHTRALSVLTDSEVETSEFVHIDDEQIREQVKSTKENLENAIDGEIYETKTMYKNYVKNADDQNEITVRLSFSLAREAEKIHAKLYKKYLKRVEKGKPIEGRDIYVCKICGNVEFDEATENCPLCDHSQQFFEKVS